MLSSVQCAVGCHMPGAKISLYEYQQKLSTMMSNKIMSSNDNNKSSSDYYYGFSLLLEAVEYHELSMNTSPPLCHHEKGGVVSNPTPSCTLAPTKQSQYVKVSYTYTNAGPPKKRFKMIGIEEDTMNYGTQSRYNLSTTNITKSSFFKTPSNCPAGSSHREWESVDECVTAATSYHRLELVPSSSSTQVNKKQHMNTTSPHQHQQDTKTFILYDEGDDKYINSVHNIIRRDIWEGFVVGDDDTVKDSDTITSQNQDMPAKSIGRLARYQGTVGFRCRFCKHVPLGQRAENSAVYPRSIENIYTANLRFQRHHIG